MPCNNQQRHFQETEELEDLSKAPEQPYIREERQALVHYVIDSFNEVKRRGTGFGTDCGGGIVILGKRGITEFELNQLFGCCQLMRVMPRLYKEMNIRYFRNPLLRKDLAELSKAKQVYLHTDHLGILSRTKPDQESVPSYAPNVTAVFADYHRRGLDLLVEYLSIRERLQRKISDPVKLKEELISEMELPKVFVDLLEKEVERLSVPYKLE